MRSLTSIQSRAIVVIDEAQSLSPTLLDEVRMLTALERDGRRLVQIVLCGQPMLLNTLKTEPMYALNERITRRVALTPLSAAEVESYIYHRLAIAGGTDTVAFQPEAMRLIADLSRGLPRRVNVLCDRTLQEGRVISATTITSDLVKRAAKSLAGVHPPPSSLQEAETEAVDATALAIGGERSSGRFLRVALIAALVVAVLGGGAYGYLGSQWLASQSEFTMPRRAKLAMPVLAPAIAMPTDAEFEAYFKEMRAVLAAGGGGNSAELPHDRD